MGGTKEETISPTPERLKKYGGAKKINGVFKVKATCKLDVYFNNNWIDVYQWSAGIQLFMDWYYSTYNNGSSIRYDDMPRGAMVNISENQIDATIRYDRAVKYLRSPNYKTIVQGVCIFNSGLNDFSDKWAKGHAAYDLKSGLDELVRHYRIK